jgi:uncharacterized membrane protein YfcA
MTSEIIIYITAIFASGLTLISGFGLGTIMLPIFAIFFPVEIAVGMTAIVHVLNNFFKMGLIFKDVNWKTLLYFGVPGIFGAFIGAMLLLQIDTESIWFENDFLIIRPLNTVIGFLMIFFAFAELANLKAFSFKRKYLIPGGFLSGFFGGLSGHQGALRSMFLIKANLSKQAYIATGVGIALLVDITRIPIYWTKYNQSFVLDNGRVIGLATLFAFLGAYLGKNMINKVTMKSVHLIVGVLLIVMGVGMIIGLI